MTAPEAPRLTYLDGLRGWMALVVVFSHLFEIWLLNKPELQRQGAPWLADLFVWTPLGPLMDGMQAVFVFFVISGIALTYPVLRSATRSRALAILSVYRYPRLALPILASCLLSYVLLSSGSYANRAAAAHHADASFYASFFNFSPDFLGMIKSALWDTFFNPPSTDRSWNAVLWTMRYELYGSYALFLLLAVTRRRWLRMTLAACLAAYLWTGFYGGYLCGFFVGYFLAELLIASERSDWLRRKLAAAAPIGWICLIGALALSTWLQNASSGAPRTDYLPHMNAIATLTLIGVILAAPARAWLSSRLSRFLGRISFGLYLTHQLVICSFSSALFIATIDRMPYWAVVLVIAGLTLAVAIGTAYLFTLLVEEGLLRRVKRAVVIPINRALNAWRPAGASIASP